MGQGPKLRVACLFLAGYANGYERLIIMVEIGSVLRIFIRELMDSINKQARIPTTWLAGDAKGESTRRTSKPNVG